MNKSFTEFSGSTPNLSSTGRELYESVCKKKGKLTNLKMTMHNLATRWTIYVCYPSEERWFNQNYWALSHPVTLSFLSRMINFCVFLLTNVHFKFCLAAFLHFLGITPASFLQSRFTCPKVLMPHHGLGPEGGKALAKALMVRTFYIKILCNCFMDLFFFIDYIVIGCDDDE